MVNSSSSGCMPIDKGLFKTGMFLRPHIATSLQGLIHNRTIQDRAKFSVIKSQIHPNGLCEIVVKKQDPNLATSTIMELLNHCRDLVQDYCPDLKGHSPRADLNHTIDISDSDDSICILSSPHYSGRKISFKRTFSPNLESASGSAPEPLVKKLNPLNITSLDSKLPSCSNVGDSRKVSFTSANPKDPQTSDHDSAKTTTMQGNNIVIQLTSKARQSLSPDCDSANSSVVILDVVNDVHPSAPTWLSSVSSKFPLVNISKNLGKNLAMISDVNKETTASTVRTNESASLNHQKGEKAQENERLNNSVNFSKGRFSDVLRGQNSLVCPVVPPKCLGLTEDKSKMGPGTNQLSGTANQTSEKSSSTKTFQLTDKPRTSVEICSSKATEKGASSGDSPSSDDEIIIEKELKSDMKIPSLIIDSDDDIAVCEVIKPTGAPSSMELKSDKKLKKRQEKKQKKNMSPYFIPAGSNFVASTSNAPAVDFIPLNSTFRRIDPKVSNNSKFFDKNAKYQKVHEKKMKKAQAIQSRKVGSSSNKGPVMKDHKNQEKREFDGNILNPNSGEPKTGLRPIVIDASNVAVGHGRGSFSVPGLKICIKYFTERGHKVYAFAPKYRRFHVSPNDRKDLDELETQGVLSFTPSRTMQDGRRVASYDDRYIVQLAAELGGIVVSTDNYRDLLTENEAWRETIEQRLLMFTWVGDILLFPNDPLGRSGPHLQDFLRFPSAPSAPLAPSAPSAPSK